MYLILYVCISEVNSAQPLILLTSERGAAVSLNSTVQMGHQSRSYMQNICQVDRKREKNKKTTGDNVCMYVPSGGLDAMMLAQWAGGRHGCPVLAQLVGYGGNVETYRALRWERGDRR